MTTGDEPATTPQDLSAASLNNPAFVGYYSGAWVWPDDEIGWVKTILPFFDKISLILPAKLLPRVLDRDPVLAQPLYDMGLLENREPKDVLDVAASESIANAVLDELRDNSWGGPYRFTEAILGNGIECGIAIEHVGYSSKARQALAALKERGLAGSVGNDGLFLIDSDVKAFLLAVCAQTMCAVDRTRGRDAVPFRPPTDRIGRSSSIYDYFQVVAHDVDAVGADLSKLSLDEVLDIRKTHGAAYRAYLRNLRSFVRGLPGEDRWDLRRAASERREEIQDAASDLRRKTRYSNLKQNLSVGLGWAGATWTAASGNFVGAVLAATGAAVALLPSPETTSAYSYLFRVAEYGR